MSFTTNKPAQEGVSRSALHLQLQRQNASAPAFRPQIIRSLRMYPWLGGVVAAVVFAGLVGYALTLKPLYVANSEVTEEPAAGLLSDPASATFDAGKYEAFLGEQMDLMQRLDVITSAMNSLPAATYQDFGATAAQAAENIQSEMKVARAGSSYQVSIGLKGTDPRKTADIVNAITSAYLAMVRKTVTEDSDQRAQLLSEERQRIETELQAAHAEQAALGASMGVANPAGGGNPYDEELAGIRAQLTEARAAHDAAAAQLSSLSGVGASGADGLTAAADDLIASDTGLGSMKATISQRKAQLNEQMSGMTPTNPIYKQNQDEIADLDRTLDRMTTELREKASRRLQDKLRTDLQRTGDVEARLNAQLSRQIASATSAAPRLQRATEVAADIQRLDARAAAVDDALRSLRMQVNGPSQVRVTLPATPPQRPEANRKRLLLLAALPLALLFAAAAVVLARKQNKRVYGIVDIEDLLGFPPLAVLPARADVPARVFEEYVLRLAAGIESAYRSSGARTFLLTAVSLDTDIDPLATALTRKFQEIGVNVVVAAASEMLAPARDNTAAGTMEIAPGELDRAVEPWSAGFVAANVARMKTEHGIVLIESEALLNCAQTEYVARCADATILVVQCGVTTRHELLRAAELLHRLNVTGIGAVLEEMQLRHADSEFRKAIEVLERRQSASPRAETRPDERATPFKAPEPALAPEAQSVEENLSGFTAEPVPVPQQANLLGIDSECIEPDYEPSHYHEVLHQVGASWTREHESSWSLPAFAQVPAQPQVDAEVGLQQIVPEVGEPAALLREEVPEPQALPVENAVPMAANEYRIAVVEQAGGDLRLASREKMSPRLLSRREPPASNGEVSMPRKASWLDRLLRRDSDTAFKIVPDNDQAEDAVARRDQPVEAGGENAGISASEPIAQASKPDSALPKSSRLQIVPPDAAVAEEVPVLEAEAQLPEAPVFEDAEIARAEVAQAVLAPEQEPQATEPKIDAAPAIAEKPKKFSPSAWATSDAEPLESPVGRPLTFRELIERTDREAAAGQPQESPAVALPIIGHVSDWNIVAAVEATETAASDVRPAAQPVFIPEGAAVEVTPAPEPEELQPAVAPVPLPTIAAPPEPEPEPEPAFSETPEPAYAYQPRFLALDPYRTQPLEFDDIEPVFQEASRSLNASRWDPIPPLRPSRDSWRDRPSPVPAQRRGVARPPEVKDGFNSHPPQRWIPEEDIYTEPEPETLPEPLLTRQWGLLSKFQQARLTSSRPPNQGERAPDPERDADDDKDPSRGDR